MLAWVQLFFYGLEEVVQRHVHDVCEVAVHSHRKNLASVVERPVNAHSRECVFRIRLLSTPTP